MEPGIIALLAGAGVVAVASKKNDATGQVGGVTGTGSTSGINYLQKARLLGGARASTLAITNSHPMVSPGTVYDSNVIDKAIANMKAKFESWSAEQKKQACEKLMADPKVKAALAVQGVNCDNLFTWEGVSKAVSTALGTVAMGPIGGYLAEKLFASTLEEWCDKAWDEVSGWSEEAANDAGNWVEDSWNEIEETVGSWFD